MAVVAGGLGAAATESVSAPAATAVKAATAALGTGEHKVAKGFFRVETTLGGIFEAVTMTEVAFEGKVLKALTVARCVAHGTRVTKGEVLIEANTEKVDHAIKAKQAANEAGALALATAVEELRRLGETTPQTLARSVEGDRRTGEDAERFVKVARPLSEAAARQEVKNRTDYLDYAKEELRQLKKMYEADDLTEATEEIVLRRQRDTVGRAELALAQTKAASERTLKIDLPRQADDWAKARTNMAQGLASQKILLPLQLAQKRLAVAKMRRDQAKAVKDLARMTADRAKMTVKAPAAGIVYYGRCVRGQWSASPALLAKLAPKGTVTADEVIMTIVDPASLGVRASAPEKDLHLLRPGLAGRAVPGGYPSKKLTVTVASVLTVPLPGGKHDVKMSVVGPSGPVMPGMTCSVRLTAYEKPDALTVPTGAVRPDPADADKYVVAVKTAAGREQRSVTVGLTSGGKTEILSGLAAGDVVLVKGAK